jgi:hypothetical protein
MSAAVGENGRLSPLRDAQVGVKPRRKPRNGVEEAGRELRH